ncbi:MAG: autotransporter-associated beta strand repeat-containing protein [Kiritimatiellae bacterium]|nr:autotransporter-associated beta strand repeat-containing protein [Kiritimatiellia bacterium]
MKLIPTLVFVAAGFVSATASAAEWIWDGGGVDSNWSTAANWSPDGPLPMSANNTTMKFNGTAGINPIQDLGSPFILNRLEFLSTGTTPFTLDGNPFKFVANGSAQPYVFLQRENTCTIKNTIEVPANTTLNLQINTHAVRFSGLITGAGALEKLSNSGGINLDHADNTFSGGLTIRANDGNWAKFNVNASGAMGTGSVKLYGGSMRTDLNNPGGLIFNGTTSHTNTIGLFQNSPIFAGMPNGDGASATLNGNINLNTYTLHLRGGGSGTINGVISQGDINAVKKADPGKWTLAGKNTFTGSLTINNGTIKLGTDNALDPQVRLSLACATGWSFGTTATLDLNGFNLRVSQLDGSIAEKWLENILTSAVAAVLTVDQSANTVFCGSLTGALGLVKDGPGTLTLSNSLNTATGDITVSNGTLVVAQGASLGGGARVLIEGGSLSLQTSAAIKDTAALYISNNATVVLAGGEAETVGRLFCDNVQQKRGTYGATGSGAVFVDDTRFSGTGVLFVDSNPPISSSTAIWDAEGADTLLSTPENWEGDAAPAFDGTTHAIFGTGGSTAAANTAVGFYGMTFNRNSAFTLAAGNGVISNGLGGITAQIPTAVSRTYTIAENMVLSDKQTWSVTTNDSASATLSIKGQIDDGLIPCNITKTGNGPLMLSASNTFNGAFAVEDGDLRIYHSQSLGSTNGNTTVRGKNGARLILYGDLNLAEPLLLNGEKNNNGTLVVGSGSHVISGPITCVSQVRLRSYDGQITVTGGITADNDGLFVVNSGSFVTFSGKPLNLGTRTFWSDSGGVSVLAVASNTWADTLCAGGGIRCDVPNAIPAAASMRIGIGYSPNGKLDLNGCDQTISKLYPETNLPGNRIITSATPAQLTVNQSANTVVDVKFTGAVGLLKLGSGNLTLNNGTTDTTGSFIVGGGTLTVGNNGTLGNNSTNIIVTGTGTLKLQSSTALSDTATLSIANSGSQLYLATGVNEIVGYLVVNDVKMPVGTYGATGSGAQFINDTYFAGDGVLTVLKSGHPGTVFIIR